MKGMCLKLWLRCACASIAMIAAMTPAIAAITYQQGNSSSPFDPVSVVTTTFTAAQTAGDLNVVIVGWSDATHTIASVTDTKGNTYVRAVGPTVSAGNATASLYYAKNIAGASANGNTITVTFSAAVNYPDIRIAEYAGVDTAAPLDVIASATGNGTNLNSGSVTTTNANDVLVGGNYIEYGTNGVGSGYAQRIFTEGSQILEDRVVSASGSYNASATQYSSGWWIMQMAAFKAAGSGGGDVTAPTIPGGLTATPISSTQINLSWTASTDNVAVTGYLLERCQGASCTTFAQIASPTVTTYGDASLSASTTYRYRVRATDAAGNLSAYSTIANATTQAPPDTTAPSIPAGLTATASSSTQINLSWTASTDNVAVTGYLLERCQGASCTTFAQIASPTITTYSDSSLTASTAYRYRVRATDAAGNLSAYSSIANATTQTAPDTTAPTVPAGLTATAASSTQINLSWTASTDNVAVTGYLLERCQGVSCTTFAQIASPTVTTYSDSSLTASTTYRYQVRATDAAGNLSAYSTIAAATTQAAPDTTAPSVPTGLTATTSSSTQINLSWTASTDNVAVTGYLLERCQGASCTTFAQIASLTTTTYSDASLTASTTYRYQVRATDAAGNLSAYSTIANATTQVAPDTTAPSIPAGLTATASSSTQINLSWAASTDNVAVTGYLLERCQGAGCTTFAQIASPTITTYSDASLTASTTYRYQVRATDAAGNLSAFSSIATATTPAAPDTTAPSVPAGLTATAVSSTQINLSWTASTDNVAVTGYLLERCLGASCTTFAQIASPTTTTYGDSSLTASTTYRYQVRATDAAGNLSAYSSIANATTQAAPDSTAPSVPSSLIATPVSPTQINLSWNASTDNVAVTGYLLERCQGASCTTFAQIASSTTTTYSDASLSASTTYRYQVRATDAAGNLSAYSSAANGTTQAPNVVAIAYVQGNSLSPYSAAAVSVPFTVAQTASDLNVVIVGWSDSTNTITSVTDTKGNTYVRAVGPTVSAGNATAALYYAKNIAAAAANGNTVTVTFSAAVNYPDIRIAEYAGVDTTAPLDVVASASGNSTTLNSGVVTTTNVSDVLVGGNYIEYGTDGVGPGYTQRIFTDGSQILEDKIVSATGSYSASATQYSSGWWIMQMAAFKAASGGGGDVTAPTVPTGFTATPISSAQINLNWTASTDNIAVTGYLLERCQGASCTTFAQIASPATTTYSDASLTASTTYRYQVRATDAAGNLSAYSSIATATTQAAPDTTAPSVPAGLTATAASPTQINLSWNASTDNVAVTGYLLERCQGSSCTTFAQIASATITTYSDASLTAATTYRYQVRATDAAGNLSPYSNIANATTQTAPDTIAPSVPSSLIATPPSSTQINLSWLASTDNVAVTGYLLERCQGAGCTTFAQIASPTTTTYSDASLTASTTYRYQVRATDAAGNLSAYSSVANATTQAAPDTTAPSIPAGLNAIASSSTQINLSWTASTDNVAVTGYLLERCQGASCATFAQIASPTTTTYSDASLTASTVYRYQVRATDAAGNLSAYSTIAAATTQAAPDTTAPTIPAGLIATAVSPTQINVSWNASTDNVAVTGYLLERCQGSSCTTFAQIASPAATTYGDSSLTASTTYRYQVRAIDAAGNLSAYSNVANATTPAAPDTTAPSIPTGLAATSVSASQINLSWVASTDNVAVAGYLLERCQGAGCTTFAQIASPTITTYSDVSLTASTTYRYQVRATDAAGNLSAFSSIANATTLAAPDTTAPSVPADFIAIPVSSTQIDLSWAASTDDVAVAGYLLERCQGSSCTTFAELASPTVTTYSDAALTASTTYRYRVRATDVVGNLSTYSSVASATTADAPDVVAPTAPSNLSATPASTSIDLSWTESTDDVGVAAYLLERCQGSECADFALIGSLTTTEFHDTGLTPSTSYRYRVRATDAANNISEASNIQSATTLSTATTSYSTNFDLTENPISEGNVWRRTDNPWTNVRTSNGIAYGTNGAQDLYDDSYALLSGFGPDQRVDAVVERSPALATGITHEVELLLRFKDDAGSARGYECLFAYSGNIEIVRWNGAPGDFTPLESIEGAGNLARDFDSGEVISATIVGNVISVYVNGELMARAIDSTFTSGQPGIGFFTRPGGDSANFGLSSYTVSSSGTNGGDIVAPSAPTGLTASASNSQIDLSWIASTDDVGVTGYMIERCAGVSCSNFVQVAITTETSFSDLTLSPGTEYSYRVRASDAESNFSAYSNIANATTSGTPDITAPSVPEGLSATPASATQINLSWTASTDNVAVTGYLLERCQGQNCTTFAQVASPSSTTYSDSSLAPSTSYRYQIRATDAAGNLSDYSSPVDGITQASGAVSIDYVQGNSSSLYVSDTVSVPFTATQAGGDLIVVAVGWLDALATVTSISDSAGNTYTLAAGPTLSPGVATQSMYYAKNIAAAAPGANVVTVRFSTQVAYPDVRIAEYSGLDTIAPLDGSASARGTGSSMNSGTFNTTSANELLVGANFLESGTDGIGAGFTQRIFSEGSQIIEDRVVTSTGSYSAAASQYGTSWWIMQMVAFKASASSSNNIAASALVSNIPLALKSVPGANSNLSSANSGSTTLSVQSCQGSGCVSSSQAATPVSTTFTNGNDASNVCVGSLCDAGSGIEMQRDLLYANGFLKFELVHNSVASGAVMPNGVTSVLNGWSSNYGMRIAVVGSGKISVSRPDGRVLEFGVPVSGNRYVSDANVADSVTRLLDDQSNFIGWEYTDAITQAVETYDARGNLAQIRARDGQTVTMLYSDASTPASIAGRAGLLIRATDSFGNQLKFQYDNYNRLAALTDPTGQQYRFGYDEATVELTGNLPIGNLTSITFPDSFIEQIHYNQ